MRQLVMAKLMNRRERIGDCTKEQAFEILDRFYELGGNFIDTCVQYLYSV